MPSSVFPWADWRTMQAQDTATQTRTLLDTFTQEQAEAEREAQRVASQQQAASRVAAAGWQPAVGNEPEAPPEVPVQAPQIRPEIPSLRGLLSGTGLETYLPQEQPQQPGQATTGSEAPSLGGLLAGTGLEQFINPPKPEQAAHGVPVPSRAGQTAAPAGVAAPQGAPASPEDIYGSGGPQPISGADRQSRIRSAVNHARAAEAKYGVPADVSLAFAVHESGLEDRYGPGMSYHGRMAVGDEPGTPVMDWGYGPNGERVDRPQRLKSYDTPDGSFHDFADLIANSPRYRPALDRYRQTGDKAQLIRDIWAAGYGEAKTGADETVDILDRQIAPIIGQPAAAAPQAPVQQQAGAPSPAYQQNGGDHTPLTPDQSALADPDKWSLCGPVAAVAMARSRGGNWTVEQAKQLAAKNGWWNAQRGMGGLETEAQLLREMGYAAKAGAADWNRITQDVRSGNPVTLSTRWIPDGHYIVLERMDDQGRFYVGGAGPVLKKTTGRSNWMTAQEIMELGSIDGALFFDNPASPQASVANEPEQQPTVAQAAPQEQTGAQQPAPSLPPTVAQRWQTRVGAEMTAEDLEQLRMLGVIA